MHEKLHPNHRPSLEGSLKGLPLPTILQALSERRLPIVIRIIEVTSMVGAIWMQGDEVVKCVAGDLEGIPAFQCILGFAQAPRGGFRVYDQALDPYEMHPVRLDPAHRLGRLNPLMLQAAVARTRQRQGGPSTGWTRTKKPWPEGRRGGGSLRRGHLEPRAPRAVAP